MDHWTDIRNDYWERKMMGMRTKTEPHIPLEWNQGGPAPPDKADDLVERLRAHCQIEAAEEIERLHTKLAAAEEAATMASGHADEAERRELAAEAKLASVRKALEASQ